MTPTGRDRPPARPQGEEGPQSEALQRGTYIPLSRNTVRMPVLSALPSAYFVAGDTGLKQTTEAAWANKFLYVEEIATIAFGFFPGLVGHFGNAATDLAAAVGH